MRGRRGHPRLPRGTVTQALARLRTVPQDLGEVYELIYEFVRSGGKLPRYARWIEGAGAHM